MWLLVHTPLRGNHISLVIKSPKSFLARHSTQKNSSAFVTLNVVPSPMLRKTTSDTVRAAEQTGGLSRVFQGTSMPFPVQACLAMRTVRGLEKH